MSAFLLRRFRWTLSHQQVDYIELLRYLDVKLYAFEGVTFDTSSSKFWPLLGTPTAFVGHPRQHDHRRAESAIEEQTPNENVPHLT